MKRCGKSAPAARATGLARQTPPGARPSRTFALCLGAKARRQWRAGRSVPIRRSGRLLEATGNPRVHFLHCLPAFHDLNTVVGREVMETTGMTAREHASDERQTSAPSDPLTTCHRSRGVATGTI